MATLASLPRKYLENLLNTNKSAQFFPLGVSDFPFPSYPQGVPRASVVSAYLTVAKQYGNFTFNLLGEDNFQRASENPLSQGGNWGSSSFPFLVAQGQCYPANYAANSGQTYTGTALPSNQWASITLASFIVGSAVADSPAEQFAVPPSFDIQLRSAAGGSSRYNFIITGTLVDIDVVQPGNTTTLVEVDLINAPLAGDVWTAAAVGSALLLYQNGVLIASATDSSLVSGYAGLFIFSEEAPILPVNFAAINNFSCGSVTGAPNLSIS